MPQDGGFITGVSPVSKLIVGPYDTDTETLDQNQSIVQGAVLGRITTGGLLILSLSGAVDGSEVPRFVFLGTGIGEIDAVTGGAENLEIVVMTHGQVNEEELSFGTGHTKATVKTPLRDVGIRLVASSPG